MSYEGVHAVLVDGALKGWGGGGLSAGGRDKEREGGRAEQEKNKTCVYRQTDRQRERERENGRWIEEGTCSTSTTTWSSTKPPRPAPTAGRRAPKIENPVLHTRKKDVMRNKNIM